MHSSAVLVIGNGESRRHIDLKKYINLVTTVGCNALHRDVTVDHLVCCDQRMLREALDNPKSVNSLIYVREEWYHTFRKLMKNKNIRQLPDIPYAGKSRADLPRNWGSGTYAHLIAGSLNYQTIYMLGFDLYGIGKNTNNVYKDSNNYAAKNSQSVDPAYWIYQSGKIFNHFSNKKFIVVNNNNWIMPDSWKCSNVEFLNVDKFTTDLFLD
jgi:hypothetical protein